MAAQQVMMAELSTGLVDNLSTDSRATFCGA